MNKKKKAYADSENIGQVVGIVFGSIIAIMAIAIGAYCMYRKKYILKSNLLIDIDNLKN